MYVSQQMLRVHQDERLRHAEARRQVKLAAASSRGSARVPRRLRIRRRAPRLAAS